MTTKEKLSEMLTYNGLSESQAKEIIELAIPELDNQSQEIAEYKTSWNSPFSDYPVVMYNLWFMAIKPIALKWIEENKPQAWFKQAFITH